MWRAAADRKIELMSSSYAAEEARRNLENKVQLKALDKLLRGIEIAVLTAEMKELPKNVSLPENDRPILLAAIANGATHLLTGDVTHFGSYFGKKPGGALIMLPSQYVKLRGI